MNKSKVVKVYAIHPGNVPLENDEQLHYITYHDLIKLYGLQPFQCVLWDDENPTTFLGYKKENFVHLYTRQDGNYTLERED